MEAHGVEVVLQAGGLVILCHHATPRSKRSFHPGFHRQSTLACVASEKACSHHDPGIGGVGARGDGSDDNIAVVQIKHFAVHLNDGPVGQVGFGQAVPVMADFMGQTFNEMGFHVVQINAVLRAFWPSEGRNDVVKVEFKNSRVGFFFSTAGVPQALGFGIGFHARHRRFLTARQAEVIEGSFIDGEETAGRPVLRRHVGDGRSVGQRERLHARAEKFDKFANHAVLSEHLNNAQRHVRGGDAGLKGARETNTHNIGSEHVDGLAEHDRFSLNTTNTPTEDAEAVYHRGV